MSEDNNKKVDEDSILEKLEPLIFIAVIFVATLVGWYFYEIYNSSFNFHWPANFNRGDWGAMGDFFGGVFNPVLSFLTIVLLIYSTVLQRRELKETRNELAASTKALEETEKQNKKQAEALAAQVKAVSKQNEMISNNNLYAFYMKQINDELDFLKGIVIDRPINTALGFKSLRKRREKINSLHSQKILRFSMSFDSIIDIHKELVSMGFDNLVTKRHLWRLQELLVIDGGVCYLSASEFILEKLEYMNSQGVVVYGPHEFISELLKENSEKAI